MPMIRTIPRTGLLQADSGSKLTAQPAIRSLNRDSSGKLFEDMTSMHEMVRKGIGLKERGITSVVLLAATITGLVIGAKLLALGGGATIIASGAALVAMSSFMGIYAGYSIVNLAMRVLNRENIKEIEKAAAHSKLSELIEEEQEMEEMTSTHGGRSIPFAPRALPGGARSFRFGG